ncbi:MAG: hypothetical protein Q4P72_04145 [Eubacteriales bacterium]|nr:hypothetical protein [Eubacteriales bacterium]
MSYKILVVDDEADIVLMLRQFFSSKGWAVLTAMNADGSPQRLGVIQILFRLISICQE